MATSKTVLQIEALASNLEKLNNNAENASAELQRLEVSGKATKEELDRARKAEKIAKNEAKILQKEYNDIVGESGQTFKTPEVDTGQYDEVRKVAWTTFGGLYIKREVLDEVGNFSPEYEWTYNRDVDYCLRTRKLGYEIYNVPVKMLHHESKDNKRIRNESKVKMEMRNLETLKKNWKDTEWYKTL